MKKKNKILVYKKKERLNDENNRWKSKVNSQSESVVKQIYSQMPNPKVVVAVGICACTGGIFKTCYNIKGGVDTVIPVDIYVPGCAARPQAIIDGVVKALALLEQKRADYAAQRRSASQEGGIVRGADQ